VTVDKFSDHLLDRIVPRRTDDDVAIIAVHFHPTDEDR